MKSKQIWSRIGQIVLVLLGISFLTFALVMLSPGDPVRNLAWISLLFSSIWIGWEGRCRVTSDFPIW